MKCGRFGMTRGQFFPSRIGKWINDLNFHGSTDCIASLA